MIEGECSRRKLLKIGLVTTVSGLTGCSATHGSTSQLTPTSSVNSVFKRVSFEGMFMVIELDGDAGVSQINLIAPDGSIYKETDVTMGASTVRIKILDIESDGGGYEHYTPGTYNLTAIIGDRSESREIELRPNLRIIEIRQYREGEQASDYGKLAVMVENTGTAPTWIHNIAYREAPNDAANTDIGGDPGVLLLEQPERAEEAILSPNRKKIYVGVTSPLRFATHNQDCRERTVVMTVLVETVVNGLLKQRIRSTISGEVRPAGLAGEFTCTDISIAFVSEGDPSG